MHLCGMSEGGTCTLQMSAPGDLGRREAYAIKSWIYWERKRQSRMMLQQIQDGSLGGEWLGRTDPLPTLLTHIIKSSNRWSIVFHKPVLSSYVAETSSGEKIPLSHPEESAP